jgi:hypothetical protein
MLSTWLEDEKYRGKESGARLPWIWTILLIAGGTSLKPDELEAAMASWNEESEFWLSR